MDESGHIQEQKGKLLKVYAELKGLISGTICIMFLFFKEDTQRAGLAHLSNIYIHTYIHIYMYKYIYKNLILLIS